MTGGVERSDVRKFVIFFLNSESKWFPGHFNPSKRFGSRINRSDSCGVTYITRIEVVMAQCVTRVELHVSCRGLLDKDTVSKSDPLCALYIQDENGKWIEVSYKYEVSR